MAGRFASPAKGPLLGSTSRALTYNYRDELRVRCGVSGLVS